MTQATRNRHPSYEGLVRTVASDLLEVIQALKVEDGLIPCLGEQKNCVVRSARFQSQLRLITNRRMMCNAFVSSFDALTRIPWLDLLKTVGALTTAVVAFLALRTWQRQDKAKREAEFLDALIDAVHAYIVEMGRPIALVETVRIGMRSQISSWDDDESDAVAKGAVPYIKKEGARDAKRLFEALNEVRPASIKLRSLSTKGQVFSFSGYSKCHKAIEMLVWQFGRVEAVARSSARRL